LKALRSPGSVATTLLFVLIAGALAVGGYLYWEHSRRVRTTENAYINAEVVQVASVVPGRVSAVHVQENQYVKKGEPLFDVDPAPFKVAVARARAEVDLARRGTVQDTAEVRALEAELARTQSDLANVELIEQRTRSLVAKGFMSQQAVDDATAKVAVSRAGVDTAKARVEKARAALVAPSGQTPAVAAALAMLAQAELDLEHAHVVAAHDGWVVNKKLVAGSSVVAGQPLFGLIRDQSFWVDANFKETELPGVRIGQPVEIEVDMYPGHVFPGKVESFSGGTGSAFSLLPPQNATGNWVKVAQRVPVKVRFERFDADYPLRVGATATVSVRLQ
jgi:membrane fusion protein (multidrug efflux system)